MNGEFRYFCLGAAVGVAAAIILTPKSGPEARAYVNSKAMDSVDYVKTRAEDARAAATDVLDRGRQAVKKQADTVAAAFDAGKQAYQALAHPRQS